MFFAYKGRGEGADENVDAIQHAVKQFNQHQKTYNAKTWEEYKKTTAISVEVLEAIDKCKVFVCDLTYFNHNVLFEFGYAIGKGKSILVLLNDAIENAKQKYKDSFLKNIRYTPFNCSKEIHAALQAKNFCADLLNKFGNIQNIELKPDSLLYIKSAVTNESSILLTEAIAEHQAEYKYAIVTDDRNEVAYRSNEWYFQSIYKSSRVVIHLLGKSQRDAEVVNAKNSFWAGLACGLSRDVYLAAPLKFPAPLDYHEILVQYRTAEELPEAVITNTFIKKASYVII